MRSNKSPSTSPRIGPNTRGSTSRLLWLTDEDDNDYDDTDKPEYPPSITNENAPTTKQKTSEPTESTSKTVLQWFGYLLLGLAIAGIIYATGGLAAVPLMASVITKIGIVGAIATLGSFFGIAAKFLHALASDVITKISKACRNKVNNDESNKIDTPKILSPFTIKPYPTDISTTNHPISPRITPPIRERNLDDKHNNPPVSPKSTTLINKEPNSVETQEGTFEKNIVVPTISSHTASLTTTTHSNLEDKYNLPASPKNTPLIKSELNTAAPQERKDNKDIMEKIFGNNGTKENDKIYQLWCDVEKQLELISQRNINEKLNPPVSPNSTTLIDIELNPQERKGNTNINNSQQTNTEPLILSQEDIFKKNIEDKTATIATQMEEIFGKKGTQRNDVIYQSWYYHTKKPDYVYKEYCHNNIEKVGNTSDSAKQLYTLLLERDAYIKEYDKFTSQPPPSTTPLPSKAHVPSKIVEQELNFARESVQKFKEENDKLFLSAGDSKILLDFHKKKGNRVKYTNTSVSQWLNQDSHPTTPKNAP